MIKRVNVYNFEPKLELRFISLFSLSVWVLKKFRIMFLFGRRSLTCPGSQSPVVTPTESKNFSFSDVMKFFSFHMTISCRFDKTNKHVYISVIYTLILIRFRSNWLRKKKLLKVLSTATKYMADHLYSFPNGATDKAFEEWCVVVFYSKEGV